MFNFIKKVFKTKKYKKSDFTKRRTRAYNKEYYHSPTDQWLTWNVIYDSGIDCDYESSLSTLTLVREDITLNIPRQVGISTTISSEDFKSESYTSEHKDLNTIESGSDLGDTLTTDTFTNTASDPSNEGGGDC